jgi:hypothetical protein
VEIPSNLGPAEWKVHLRQNRFDDTLSPQDTFVSQKYELTGSGILSHSTAGILFVFCRRYRSDFYEVNPIGNVITFVNRGVSVTPGLGERR